MALMVGLGGLEPPASPLSGVRSNQLSYRPAFLLRRFALIVVVFARSLGHILAYAPSFAHFDASIKPKILAKKILAGSPIISWLLQELSLSF